MQTLHTSNTNWDFPKTAIRLYGISPRRAELVISQINTKDRLFTSMSQTEIRTARLLLRGARQDDLNAFHQWLCDPETMKYCSTAAHTSLSETQAWLDFMIDSPYNGVLNFTVCLLEISEPSSSIERQIVIGRAGVWDGEEIGFIFNKAYWRKGYAFEALTAILRRYWSIRKPGSGRNLKIKADVDPRNTASLKLLEKLGFEVVGHAEKTLQTHLGWCDSVYLEAKPRQAE